MLAENSQHLSECWLWAIPKSVAPTPPKFSIGQFVRLSNFYQRDSGVTVYGKILGIEWDDKFHHWVYAVWPPSYHPFADDCDILNEADLEQRLCEEKTNV